MAEYSFTTERLTDAETRIAWNKNGVSDPLNFWVIAACDVEEAKRLVAAEQFVSQDGSTIPATVALCQSWLEEEVGASKDPHP